MINVKSTFYCPDFLDSLSTAVMCCLIVQADKVLPNVINTKGTWYMFVISLCYKKELSDVDKHIAAHVKFLKKYYALGTFIMSGRKVPRTGGVIIANAASLDELNDILIEDPFYVAGVAKYDVTEFEPTMFVELLRPLIIDSTK